MLSHVHFVSVAAWLLLGIAGLLWALGCAVTATKMEKEGFAFRKAFLACLLLTPLAGLLAMLTARILRPSRALPQAARR
ncbi:MAG: hypothetical protein WA192_07490 [Candidatus Acidiferrales bacterium]